MPWRKEEREKERGERKKKKLLYLPLASRRARTLAVQNYC